MPNSAELEVTALLQDWAKATRKGQKDLVLKNHLPDVLIFDVLEPLKYESAAAYRKSWDDWQPETQGESQFDLENLNVTADDKLAFAHALIRCGGRLPDGSTFEDLVRATFCLRKDGSGWKVVHQHISKPMALGKDGT